MRYTKLGVLFCGLFLALPGLAQEAENLLDRMQDEHQHEYQGSFIYERKDVFSTHYMWNGVDAAGQRLERFLQLNGNYFELFRKDGEVVCAINSAEHEQFLARKLQDQELDWEELSQWYSLQMLGQSRVAGRPAVVILFAPRDEYRYPLELHLDEQTAVPLKSLLLNEEGQLLERFQFVTFVDGALREQDFDFSYRPCDSLAAPSAADVSSGVVWQFDWLPDGFRPVYPQVEDWELGQKHISNQSFTDGLAQFSVFLEPLDDRDVMAAHMQLGPTTVITQQLDTPNGAYMLTVLGEIPPIAAEQMARSIRIGN